MADNGTRRIFCPIHEAAFEVAVNPKITCEITGHALSGGFPASEYWEFCCNCQTFSPSKLGKGEKAGKTCFSCQNEISKRFVCASCKTVSFVCVTKAKGQSYFVTEQGIAPFCPGCKSAAGKNIIRHDCTDADAELFTGMSECPFCLEGTQLGFVLPNVQPVGATNQCRICRSDNPAGALYCGTCRSQLGGDVTLEPRPDLKPTEPVETICSNCGTPNPPDSDFCGECGQTIFHNVVAPPPPPPPPPPKKTEQTTNPFDPEYEMPEFATAAGANGGTSSVSTTAAEIPDSAKALKSLLIIALVVGGISLPVIWVAVANSGTKTPVVANYAAVNYAVNVKPASNTRANAINVPANVAPSNTLANSSDPVIGKTGTLNFDTNLREFPDKLSSKLGTHYRDARIKILEVKSVPNDEGSTSRWYKIYVTQYGVSMDPANEGKDKDDYSQDTGWVNSYPVVWDKSLKKIIHKTLIRFD